MSEEERETDRGQGILATLSKQSCSHDTKITRTGLSGEKVLD